MRAASFSWLVLASLTKLANAEDLLFYNDMLYNEYSEATKTLGHTAHIASDAEWRSYTTADFAKYKAIIIPDPNCGAIDKIKFLEDTKAVWSPAVTGNMIIIGTDPTYHSSSRSGAINLIDDSIRFAASDSKGTGLYFSLSCYYDSGDIATIDALSEFGTFYVKGRLACYNDAHLVANAPELKSLDDSSIGNWSCSVHEVFTEFPKRGMEPGTDGFEAFAIARNATGDGEDSYADASAGIPYIIARGATPVGCGDGKIEASFGEECDNGKDANGVPGNPCSTSCKCLFGVLSPGICKLSNTTSSSSSMSSSSTVFSNSSTALPSPSSNSTLLSSSSLETMTPPASSTGEPASATLSNPTTPGSASATGEPSDSSPTSSGALPSPAEPSKSSNLTVGFPPPATVTASGSAPNQSTSGLSSAQLSASGTPPSESLPPITIVTTIAGPTPSVITVIATADPPLSAESDSSTRPLITIITTINGGPVPSLITIIADPPPITHPMSSPETSGTSNTTIPSYIPSTTIMGSLGNESSRSTTVLTIGGSGDGGPRTTGPVVSPISSTRPSNSSLPGSASPSSVTIVTSAGGGNSGNTPATSAAASNPSDSVSKPSDTSQLSTETSIRTVLTTAAPDGATASNSRTGFPSSASVSAPAGPSSGAAPISGPPTSVASSVQTIVHTISAPGSGLSNGAGSSSGSGVPSVGSPTSGTLSSLVSRGSSTAGQSGTASSAESSFVSAVHSGFSHSAVSVAPSAPGSAGSGSTNTVVSDTLVETTSRALTRGEGSGTDTPSASATPAPGNVSTNLPTSDIPASSSFEMSASDSDVSTSVRPSTVVPSSISDSLSDVTASTSLPSDPHMSIPDSTGISSIGSISNTASGNPLSRSDGPVISGNGTILTASSQGSFWSVLPTTIATTTLPAGPESSCGVYIGIEVIEFIQITEVCSEGATITETITTCISTMTRPICHTITPGYPCYPCMGITPSAGETATVTRSSCSTSNPITTTIIAQTCHACEAITYTTTSLPGYTPGDGCKDCQPYLSGDLTLPPTTVTVDATSTTPARISKPGCHNCPDDAPTRYPDASDPVDGLYSRPPVGGGDGPASKPTTVVPGTRSLPTLSLSATSGGGYGGPPMESTTSATVSKPSTVPSYVTAAGGPRGLIWELSTVVAAAVLWALLMV